MQKLAEICIRRPVFAPYSRHAAMSSSSGQRRLAGTSAARSAASAECRLTARLNARLSSASRRIPGTTPTVLIVTREGASAAPRSSVRISSAVSSAS